MKLLGFDSHCEFTIISDEEKFNKYVAMFSGVISKKNIKEVAATGIEPISTCS